MTSGDYDPNAPQYGQPQYGQPQYGQPQGGQPQGGQPQYGQPQYGQPQYGQPQYGQPQGGYPPSPLGGQPGSLGVRFGARVIDGILVSIVVSILVALVWDNYALSFGIFSGFLLFVYFVAFEVTQGWTPGKKILGLSVHGPGGAPKPTLQQSAIRNSFMLLSIIPFLGGLLALAAYIVIAVTINSSPTKQGKHDELAGGTQVVKR